MDVHGMLSHHEYLPWKIVSCPPRIGLSSPTVDIPTHLNGVCQLFRGRRTRETRVLRRINGCSVWQGCEVIRAGRAAVMAAYVRNLGLLPTN